MTSRIGLSLALVLAASAIGCGGGGSSSTQSGATPLSGVVSDGLIENAKVCLDLNNNLACDANEPSATTDKSGRYSIAYSGSLSGVHVVAVVTGDSKDADDGGQTIAQAGKEPFNLASPATKPEVVSPLTTLVSHAILSDPSLSTNSADLAKAEERVKASTGLKVDLLGNNYVSAGDTGTHNVAKAISVALGDVAKEVKAAVQSRASSDTALSAALSEAAGQRAIQAAVVKTVTSMVASSLGSDGALARPLADVIAENKSAASQVVSGQINNIIVGTKAGEAKVADAAAILAKGLIIGNTESDYLENGTPFEDALQVAFLKISAKERSVYAAERVLYAGSKAAPSWEKRRVWGKSFVLTKNNTWLHDPDIVSEGTGSNQGDISADQNCITMISDVNLVTANIQFCLAEKDVAGKLISALIPDYCNDEQKTVFPNCDPKATFKPGSKAYDLTLGVTEDRYQNEVGINWDGYTTTGGVKTLDAFIDYTKKSHHCMGDNCNSAFMIKTYDATTKKGVMKWADRSKAQSSAGQQVPLVWSEETSFEVRRLGSIDMLVLDPSSIYNRNNQNDGVGRKFIFNYMEDKTLGRSGIYKGELQLKATKRQLDFDGNVKVGSPELLDSFLSGLGMTPFPYPTSPVILK